MCCLSHLTIQVLDFSEAERSGFIKAYIWFWREERQSERSEDELRREAQGLLKGCQQHFKAACTRIRKLTSIIPRAERHDFKKLCKTLRTVPDMDTFESTARSMVARWPRTSSWLAWWLRPSHAPMIFQSQIVMDAFIWASIPDTTNAEEAMHWRLYCGAGRDHELIQGLYALYSMARYFERLFSHAEG